jgi:hypothetical protein
MFRPLDRKELGLAEDNTKKIPQISLPLEETPPKMVNSAFTFTPSYQKILNEQKFRREILRIVQKPDTGDKPKSR